MHFFKENDAEIKQVLNRTTLLMNSVKLFETDGIIRVYSCLELMFSNLDRIRTDNYEKGIVIERTLGEL